MKRLLSGLLFGVLDASGSLFVQLAVLIDHSDCPLRCAFLAKRSVGRDNPCGRTASEPADHRQVEVFERTSQKVAYARGFTLDSGFDDVLGEVLQSFGDAFTQAFGCGRPEHGCCRAHLGHRPPAPRHEAAHHLASGDALQRDAVDQKLVHDGLQRSLRDRDNSRFPRRRSVDVGPLLVG